MIWPTATADVVKLPTVDKKSTLSKGKRSNNLEENDARAQLLNKTDDHRTIIDTPGGQVNSASVKSNESNKIIWMEVLKSTQLFVVVTRGAIYVYRLKPLCAVAVFTRTEKSILTHGLNLRVCFRPDGRFIAIATENNFLYIVRILLHDIPSGEVCVFGEADALDTRQSLGTFPAPGEGSGVREVNIRCDTWVQVSNGIQHILGLESRLIIVSNSRVCACDWEELIMTNDVSTNGSDIPSEETEEHQDEGTPRSEGESPLSTTVDHIAWSKAMGLFATIKDGKVSTGMLGSLPPAGEWCDLVLYEQEGNANIDSELVAGEHDRLLSPTAADIAATSPFQSRPSQPAGSGNNKNRSRSTSRSRSRSRSNTLAASDDYPEEGPTPKYSLMAMLHDTHDKPNDCALTCALNARFSAVAVGCKSGAVYLYNIRDYSGNIRQIRIMRPPSTTAGSIRCLRWSMDGYALFVGYATGWALFSVYGMLNASSFLTTNDQKLQEPWLGSIQFVAWSLAADRLFLCPDILETPNSPSFWSLKTTRWASLNNFSTDNLHRPILIEDGSLSVYRGHNQPGLTTIDREALLWLRVPIPGNYVADNWPIRYVSTSQDGRYIAIAGSRGLSHYSLYSGRWKLFDDEYMDLEFSVRAMLWGHQHYLFVAVDTDRATHELRVYSRDLDLHPENVLAAREFLKPILRMCLYKSLLFIYTYDNILHVYEVRTLSSVALYPLRKINLESVVHSPARVRSLACVPSNQQSDDSLVAEDPDIAGLNLVLLVDGMLTVLYPNLNFLNKTANEEISYNVYKKITLHHTVEHCHITSDGMLWAFDGQNVLIWDTGEFYSRLATSSSSVEPADVSHSASSGDTHWFNAHVPVESYPVVVLRDKGIVAGVDTDTVLNRHAGFTSVHCFSSTQLYVPYILEAYLERNETEKAYQLAKKYQHLKYMSHILEMLLYRVMDAEQPADSKLLQHAVKLVCQFPQMLDVFLGCTRKTEIKYWGDLFEVLGSPQELFDRCLSTRQLTTAAGYLLILHTVEDTTSKSKNKKTSQENTQRLLKLAYGANDFELCKELARFLTAIDPSAKLLRATLQGLDLDSGASSNVSQTCNK